MQEVRVVASASDVERLGRVGNEWRSSFQNPIVNAIGQRSFRRDISELSVDVNVNSNYSGDFTLTGRENEGFRGRSHAVSL
jgi:hypothetical protein